MSLGSTVQIRRSFPVFLETILLGALFVFSAGCGHSRQAHVNPPPPPPITAENPPGNATAETAPSEPSTRVEPNPRTGSDLAEPKISPNSIPIQTETGLASWYGPPYNHRHASNGEIYNMHAMTAAHRTLPLGSIVRVTNLRTGHHVLVRITDRGPFIPGRIVDLSLAAARRADVYLPGVAEVKLEVMETPVPIDSGGKWAVQIGGFRREKIAIRLADRLRHRYRTAQVLSFPGPTGDWWIRVRVLDDDHRRAQSLAAETRSPDGAVFLVRLD